MARLWMLAFWGVFVACSRADGNRVHPSNERRYMEPHWADSISLDLQVVGQTEQALTLVWTLANRSPETVVVLRHQFRSTDAQGRYVIEPGLLYVSADAAGNVVAGSWILPVPERGLQVLTPFVPLGDELGAGERMSHTVTLPLPLREWDPYLAITRMHHPGSAARTVPVQTLRFRLGVYSSLYRMAGVKVQTNMGPMEYPSSTEIIGKQILVESAPIPLSAAVVL